jgi:hypothetical protein
MKSILLLTNFSSNANRVMRYALNIFKYTLPYTYEVPYSGATMLMSNAVDNKSSNHSFSLKNRLSVSAKPI